MMNDTKTANNIWDIPFLPPIPQAVRGKEGSICLSNRTKGEWQFLPAEIAGIPSPYAASQDFDFCGIEGSLWKDCIVPSSLAMQGYKICNNAEYYYRRTLHAPVEFMGNRVFVRFEGVYCNARIWVNGKYLTTHIGGFTPFDVEITQFAEEEMCLVVGISDIEGKSVGIWNPNGNAVSDASWGSFYAHHNICGILREVTLYRLEEAFLVSIQTNVTLTQNGATVRLRTVVAGDIGADVEFFLEDARRIVASDKIVLSKSLADDAEFCKRYPILYDEKYKLNHKRAYAQDLKYSELYVPFQKCEIKKHLYAFEVHLNVADAHLWTAENPFLYTLRAKVTTKNGCADYASSLGLRDITYGATAANEILVNGAPVKLRGVCRHDVSHLYGRSLTREDAYEEISAYKRNNVNFIRTSHYPADKYIMQACDELGMYVEVENSVCFKGANNYEMLCAPEEILQTLSEMIAFHRNHPSVILWSIANESGFEKSAAFRMSYQYVKEQTADCPIIFSYPFTVTSLPRPYDIFSKHYARVGGRLGKADMPVLHDEFAHVCCYNLAEIRKDNAYRLYWGDSIRKGWDNIIRTKGALGCAIWAAIDDVFPLPAGIESAHQRHTSGAAVGYGEWGAILDHFKREKPEAYLTKKAFAPIKILDWKWNGQKINLKVQNRFDHTYLDEVRVVVRDLHGEQIYESKLPRVAPHSDGDVSFPAKTDGNYTDVAFYHGGYEVEREIFDLRKSSRIAEEKPLTISAERKKWLCNLGNASVEIDETTAEIGIKKDGVLLADTLRFCVDGRSVSASGRKVRSVQQSSGAFTAIMEERNGFGKKIRYRLRVTPSGILVQIALRGLWKCLPCAEYGATMRLTSDVEAVEWERIDEDCRYYPEGHLGRLQGRALVDSAVRNIYGVKPAAGWCDDVYNHFLTDARENNPLPIRNDFKTTRADIRRYCVQFTSGCNLTVAAERDGINCFTDKDKTRKMISCSGSVAKRAGQWRIRKAGTYREHAVSRKKGSWMELEFFGDGVNIMGTRSKKQGDISLFVDGVHYADVSTKSDICDTLDFTVIASVSGLPRGTHTLRILLLDDRGLRISGYEICDALRVEEICELYVHRGKNLRGLGWGNDTGRALSNSEKTMEYQIEI